MNKRNDRIVTKLKRKRNLVKEADPRENEKNEIEVIETEIEESVDVIAIAEIATGIEATVVTETETEIEAIVVTETEIVERTALNETAAVMRNASSVWRKVRSPTNLNNHETEQQNLLGPPQNLDPTENPRNQQQNAKTARSVVARIGKHEATAKIVVTVTTHEIGSVGTVDVGIGTAASVAVVAIGTEESGIVGVVIAATVTVTKGRGMAIVTGIGSEGTEGIVMKENYPMMRKEDTKEPMGMFV